MTQTQALKLALECMELEVKGLNINANLADKYHADSPECIKASKRRGEILEAMEKVKETMQAPKQTRLF